MPSPATDTCFVCPAYCPPAPLCCPATAAPSAKLRRNTRLEAERARNNATINVLTAADTPAEITGQVVCGANSLTATNFNVHCRIVATFPNGRSGSCSAAKVGTSP